MYATNELKETILRMSLTTLKFISITYIKVHSLITLKKMITYFVIMVKEWLALVMKLDLNKWF